MNSSRKVEQDWLSIAQRKFVGATIHNFGQFAVCVMNHKDVFLFADFFDAIEFAAKDSKYRLHDLSEELVQKTTGFSNIKGMSDAEDREWERRFDRERRENRG